MAEESFEEKTEKATPRKREEIRKKGQVAKSREIPSVAVLLAGLVSMTVFGSYLYSHIGFIMREGLSFCTISDLSVPDVLLLSKKMIGLFLLAILPVLIAVFLAAVFSDVMQVGFMASGELIRPNLSKIDPIKGFGRLFSIQSVMEVFKSLVKLAIVGAAVYFTVRSEMKNVQFLGDMEVNSIVGFILRTMFKISLRCILAAVVLVAMDYAFQKWDFERKIRMTRKEVKDEFKRAEGDPLVKSRIRSIQKQVAKRRTIQMVSKEDVVITSRTGLAVALRYDGVSMDAPRLAAKGSGQIGRKIKEAAESRGVPVVEKTELAQSLYSTVEVGQEIPPILYQAMAEVLASINKLKGNPSSLGS
jgi:flagellar biosynthetic protein FlhB